MNRLREPQIRRFELSGLELQVLEWAGEGPPLLMLHGWLDQSWSFDALAQYLKLPLLAWDARGHGHSGWAASWDFYHFHDYLWDLYQLIETLNLAPALLLGHSMGGMIASLYAGIWPERVAGLINLEGWIVPDSPATAVPERVRTWVEQRSNAQVPRPLASHAAASERLLRQDPRLSPEKAEDLASHAVHALADGLFWHHDPRHRMRSPQPFRLDQAQACWERISCPILLAWGAESEALKLPDFEARLDLFPAANRCRIHDAGHNLHLHQPELLADNIMNWIDRAILQK